MSVNKISLGEARDAALQVQRDTDSRLFQERTEDREAAMSEDASKNGVGPTVLTALITGNDSLKQQLRAVREEARCMTEAALQLGVERDQLKAAIERLKAERLAWQGAGHGPWREAEAERKEKENL